jgi:hypothetical protein
MMLHSTQALTFAPRRAVANGFSGRQRAEARSRVRQAWGLLETAFVLIIAIGAMAAGAQFYMDYLKNQTVRTTAEQMNAVSKAFSKYLEDEYGTVLAQASATGRVEIPIEDLQPDYLSPSFYNKNPYGQEFVLAVRKPDPAKANLEGIVYTRGGEEIPPDQALMIAQSIGAAGGFTLRGGSATQVRTTFDSFELNLADYGANPGGSGKVVSALFLNELGAVTTDYLYRNAVAGHPELNQMNTNLGMNNHNITAVNELQTNSIAATGNIVTSGGTVKGQTLQADQSVTAATGDISAPNGTVRGGQLVATTGLSVGTNATIGGNVNASGSVTAGGAITAIGRVTGSVLYPTLIAGENASCAGYNQGDIANSSTGRTLSCQSGIWRSVGGALTVTGSTCPAGYAPAAYYVETTGSYPGNYAWQGHNFAWRCHGPGGDAGQDCGLEPVAAQQIKCIQ